MKDLIKYLWWNMNKWCGYRKIVQKDYHLKRYNFLIASWALKWFVEGKDFFHWFFNNSD